MESMVSRIMLYGILIQKRSLVMHDDQERGLVEEEEEEGGREGYHPILPYLPTCTHENVVYMCTYLPHQQTCTIPPS